MRGRSTNPCKERAAGTWRRGGGATRLRHWWGRRPLHRLGERVGDAGIQPHEGTRVPPFAGIRPRILAANRYGCWVWYYFRASWLERLPRSWAWVTYFDDLNFGHSTNFRLWYYLPLHWKRFRYLLEGSCQPFGFPWAALHWLRFLPWGLPTSCFLAFDLGATRRWKVLGAFCQHPSPHSEASP